MLPPLDEQRARYTGAGSLLKKYGTFKLPVSSVVRLQNRGTSQVMMIEQVPNYPPSRQDSRSSISRYGLQDLKIESGSFPEKAKEHCSQQMWREVPTCNCFCLEFLTFPMPAFIPYTRETAAPVEKMATGPGFAHTRSVCRKHL